MTQYKRITVEMLEKDHKKIKKIAAEQGVSIKKLITDSVALYIARLKSRVIND